MILSQNSVSTTSGLWNLWKSTRMHWMRLSKKKKKGRIHREYHGKTIEAHSSIWDPWLTGFTCIVREAESKQCREWNITVRGKRAHFCALECQTCSERGEKDLSLSPVSQSSFLNSIRRVNCLFSPHIWANLPEVSLCKWFWLWICACGFLLQELMGLQDPNLWTLVCVPNRQCFSSSDTVGPEMQ